MSFLSEDLITSIKNRSFVPVSQDTFTEDDILLIASEEMKLGIVADIMKTRQDFFLTSKQTTVTAGIDRYGVPAGAIGNALKNLFLLDSAGGRKKLSLLDIDNSPAFNGSSGEPQYYYFEGDEVILLPSPSTGYSLEFMYFRSPSQLALTETCAKITVVSTVAGVTTLTVDTDLTADLSIGDEVDFLSAKSPFLLWADEVTIVAISSTQIQVASTDIDDAGGTVQPQVGDYICPTGTANIPMIPPEWHPVLAQSTAVRLLMGLGDNDKFQLATQRLDRERAAALTLIKNRVESSPERITQRNGILTAFRLGR